MANVIRLVLSVVFGLLWMLVYTYSGFSVLVVLGSILTLCVCCCRGGDDLSSEWSFQGYLACLGRCRAALLVLILALFLIGVLWEVVNGNPMPAGSALVQLAVAAIGSVFAVRLICCLYD
ncbi:MAG: hypothetical protein O7A98_10000 [Acidobacteria bacterium]|nr:hypothetical protein [Acidobacteriota bacterium]